MTYHLLKIIAKSLFLHFRHSISPDSVLTLRPNIRNIQTHCRRIRIHRKNVRTVCMPSNCRAQRLPLRALRINARGSTAFGRPCNTNRSCHTPMAVHFLRTTGMSSHRIRINCDGCHSKLSRPPRRRALCRVCTQFAVLAMHATDTVLPFTCIFAMRRWRIQHFIIAMAIF